jgi:hypothetical protein
MLPKKLRERDVKAEQKAMQNMRIVGEQEEGFAHVISGVAGVAAVGVVSALGRIAGSSEKLADSTSGLFDTIKSKIEEFAQFCKKAIGSIWVIPVAILAHALLSPHFHQPVVCTFAAVFLARLFGADLWRSVSNFFRPEQQSGEGVAGIGGLICTVLCTAMLPTKNVALCLGELMKRMANFDRSKEGFESFFRSALKYAERAANCLLRTFSLKEVQWVSQSEKLVDEFCRKVDDFEKLVRSGSKLVTTEKCMEMAKLHVDAIGLKSSARDDRLRLKVERAFSRLSLIKRLLRMNGEGIKFLTGFETRSSGSSDLHSERAEVGTESLLSGFIDQQIDRQRFIQKLIQESSKLEETSVSEDGQ